MINCQIVFRQYCEACGQDNASLLWGLAKDFLLPLALAFLATYTALRIFFMETRRDQAKEIQRKIEERRDKLLYLSMMVHSCIKVAEKQAGNIKAFIEKVQTDDISFHEMSFVTLNDLKRVSEVLNLELYMLAYVNTYTEDRKRSIKEFKDMISCNDYLLGIFIGITEQLAKAQDYDYKRKLAYKEKFDTTFKELSDMMNEWKGPQPLANEIQEIYQDFEKNEPGDRYNLQYPFDYFFVPYAALFDKYLNNLFLTDQQYHDLAHHLNQGIQTFNHIKSQNKVLGDQLAGDYEQIQVTIADMKKNARNLLELLDE